MCERGGGGCAYVVYDSRVFDGEGEETVAEPCRAGSDAAVPSA